VWGTTANTDVGEYAGFKASMLAILKKALVNSIADNGDPNVLCRNFRKIFNGYLSMAAGELSDPGTAAMFREIREKGHSHMIPMERYLTVLKRCPFDIAQDIGRLYKLLPAPDYDIGEAFCDRAKDIKKPNVPTELDGENPATMDEFRLYLRKHMAVTLANAHGGKGQGRFTGPVVPKWFRAYAERGVFPKDLAKYDQIDFTGVEKYVERHEESVVSWKDSACCEEDFDDAMADEDSDIKTRNMLLRYLFDNKCPTARSARLALGRKCHVHRAGFKMEAHKAIARIFYIGNLSDRLAQSEMEENVHRVALHAPGYMIGQTPEFTSRKTMKMVAPQLIGDARVFYLNFDISRWSPAMPAYIQRYVHNLFGEVFDRAEFSRAHHINEGATVILNKRGYEAAYTNIEANFEGYNGKEMTFMHCAMMGYAVYRYRRATGEERTVELCAYIDDGLAAFKDVQEGGRERFLHFVDIVEETYTCLGFRLERSKCYLSSHFAIFLNEIYFGGRKITYGLRAIMRVGTTAFEPHETMCARLNTYFSGVQGAMKAGMDMVGSMIVGFYLMGRLLRSYGVNKWMDAKAAVLYLFTPRALGGCGVAHVLGMATNLLGDGLTEGISAIKELARAYPEYKQKVIALLRQKVGLKSNSAILLAPKTVPVAEYAMRETRLQHEIAKALSERTLSNVAHRFLAIAKKMDLAAFADAILETSVAVVPALLDDIIAGTPYALLLSLVKKFESARTMTQLIGKHRMHVVFTRNNEDALNSMAAFRLR